MPQAPFLPSPAAEHDTIPPIILLVDADRDAREMYTTFFEMSGMWVATTTGPGEAVDAVDELKPDVIIANVDCATRPLDRDLVAALAHRDDTVHIPLIVLSGDPASDLPADVRRDADLCLEKPVLPDRLLADVRLLVDHSRTLRARGDAAREKAHRLADKSAALAERARTIHERVDRPRTCPDCGTPLEWIERGRISGVEYDYFRWCDKGCGLYCYDCEAHRWVKLA